MEQRDLIVNEIEQLGRVLGKILADFLGLKTNSDITSSLKISKEQFDEEANIDIEAIIKFNESELREYIKEKKLASELLNYSRNISKR